jgi:hypothetical protein
VHFFMEVTPHNGQFSISKCIIQRHLAIHGAQHHLPVAEPSYPPGGTPQVHASISPVFLQGLVAAHLPL